MLDKSSYDVLILHIVRDSRVFLEFCTKSVGRVFDPVLYTAHDVLSRVALELFDQFEKFPGLAAFKIKLTEHMLAEDMPEDVSSSVHAFFEEVCKYDDSELCPDIALDILTSIINNQLLTDATRTLSCALASGDTPHNVMRRLGEEIDKRSVSVDDTECVHMPFLNYEEHMVANEYFSTGVEYLDLMLNGGPRRHDFLGLIAPTSGGKTTITLQLATSWLRQHSSRHAVVFSYEQPLKGDVMERLLSLATDIPSTEFRGKTSADLSDETRLRLREAAEIFKTRLHFIDFSTSLRGMRGVNDIEKSLKSCGLPKDDGEPTLVLIDWLMPFVHRAMEGEGLSPSDQHGMFGIAAQLMDRLKILKNKSNIILFITQQMDAPSSAASPNRKPIWTDAADWKKMSNFTDVCFAVGTLSDPERIGWIVSSKARGVAKTARFIKLEGDRCRFVDVNSQYMISSGGKIVSKDLMMEDVDDAPRANRNMSAAAQFAG